MHRFIKGLVLAAIPVAVVAALAGTASAATAKADGTVIVSKGDVQTAMKWNDAQFQANLDNVTFTGTASAGSTQVVSPTTGLWHDYVVDSENMNDVASPAGYEQATGGWCPDTVAYGPDVLLPNEATIAATPVKNSQGKVTGFKVAAGTVKTTRYNLSYCHEGPGGYTSDGHTYDRYVSDYFTGSVTSVQVNGINVPITPAA